MPLLEKIIKGVIQAVLRKIRERKKEHFADIKFNKPSTALTHLAMKEKIAIDLNKIEKLASYRNKLMDSSVKPLK